MLLTNTEEKALKEKVKADLYRVAKTITEYLDKIKALAPEIEKATREGQTIFKSGLLAVINISQPTPVNSPHEAIYDLNTYNELYKGSRRILSEFENFKPLIKKLMEDLNTPRTAEKLNNLINNLLIIVDHFYFEYNLYLLNKDSNRQVTFKATIKGEHLPEALIDEYRSQTQPLNILAEYIQTLRDLGSEFNYLFQLIK